MGVIDVRNIIPIGLLDDNIYPSVYNPETKQYSGDINGEGEGIKTEPAIYLYYRHDGNLYLYKTSERSEINITNISIYDNNVLFKLTELDDISNLDIIDFNSKTIVNNSVEYSTVWIKKSQEYIYILIPVVFSLQTITIQNTPGNSLFNLIGLQSYNDKYYWVYKTNIKSNFEFKDNETLSIILYFRELIVEDLNLISQLSEQLNSHINNQSNPHSVTKEQLGLSDAILSSDIRNIKVITEIPTEIEENTLYIIIE